MDEIIKIANELKEANEYSDDFNKYCIIFDIVNRPDWLYEVKSEYAIKMLEDLKFESPKEKYMELMVDSLNNL